MGKSPSSFRRIVLEDRGGTWTGWQPGDKVQLLLPSSDMRTYTPVPEVGSARFTLVGWRHAGGPGARWISEVSVGDVVEFVGPQRSLRLSEGPVVLVGDETSMAVAASFEVDRPGKTHVILGVSEQEQVRAVAESLGIVAPELFEREAVSSVVDAVCRARAGSPEVSIGITGGSELLVGVRRGLRAKGITDARVKVYWVPGKVGLD